MSVRILSLFDCMRIKKNYLRMKSEVVQLDYISPWKPPLQSARNALEFLLTKSKILEEVSLAKQITKNDKDDVVVQRSKTSSPKKTSRTNKKDNKDQMRKSYLQHFYSKSQPLRKGSFIKKIKGDQQIIFATKHQKYHRPKLITVGNQCLQQSPKTLEDANFFWKQRTIPVKHNNFQLSNNKKQFLLKKQRASYQSSKKDVDCHKDFIDSLHNCLVNMQKTLCQKQATQQLRRTLKDVVGKYKKI